MASPASHSLSPEIVCFSNGLLAPSSDSLTPGAFHPRAHHIRRTFGRHIRFPGVTHNKRNNNDHNIVPHSNLRLPIIIIEHGHYRNDGGYEWYDDGKGDGVWRPAARSHRPATGGQRLLEKCGGQTNSSTQKTPNRPKYV